MTSSSAPIAFASLSMAAASFAQSAFRVSGSRATATNGLCPSVTFDFFATSSRSLPWPFTLAPSSAAGSIGAYERSRTA